MFLDETGFDTVNRRRKKERDAHDRMKDTEDRHRDYHHHSPPLSLPLYVPVSDSTGHAVSNQDTGGHLNHNDTTTTSTSNSASKVVKMLNYQDSELCQEKANSRIGREKEKMEIKGRGRGRGGGSESVRARERLQIFLQQEQCSSVRRRPQQQWCREQ
jgi:hypothetical protein